MRIASRLVVLLVLWTATGCRPVAAGPRAVPVPADVAAGVTLTRVVSGLSKPLALAFAPGDRSGRLFVVEQTGRIRIVRNGAAAPENAPFVDLSARISASAGDRESEQGLLGLAFHPRFAENGRLFVNFTDRAGDTRVVEFAVRHDVPDRVDEASEREILHVPQPYENHNGGNLVFGSDGRLYVGLGDGGSAGDPHANGQNPQALLGKMLAIDVDAATPSPTIIALGLRNPWRYSFDRATGDLWIADVGQNAFEEVDVLTAGMRASGRPVNYGWNVTEGFHCFRAPTCDQHAFTPPIVEYGHGDGCSITGGYVYRGRRLPALAGLYFYADYCSAMIRSLRRNGAHESATDVWDWRGALDPGDRLARIASFGEDADGELYLLSLDGDVYAFVPSGPPAGGASPHH